MRLSIAILCAVSLATASPVMAEQKPKPSAGAAATPGDPAPSPHMLALSRRYVDLMQGDQMTTLFRSIMDEEMTSHPEMRAASQEDRDFTTALTTQLIDEMIPAMMEELVPIYARTFSEPELQALVDFYGSEQGLSITRKTYETMPAAQEAMLAVMPPLLEKMAARLCEHYGCDADEVAEGMSDDQGSTARTK